MKPKDYQACEECVLKKVCKDNILCRFCERRIQAAKGELITAAFPTLKDLKKALENLREDFATHRDIKNLAIPDKNRVCESCGCTIAINNVSGYCADCYRICGKECRMPDCHAMLSKNNRSGLCANCYNIVNRRKHEGLPESEWYLPATFRRKKED